MQIDVLPVPTEPGDEDRVPSRDAPVQDVVNRIDAGDASLTLAGVALLRGHRLGNKLGARYMR